MPSAKPEVHNVLHGRQTRTEPRPQLTHTEISVKFGHVACEIHERTDIQIDIQTNTLITILRTPSGGEVITLDPTAILCMHRN